MEKVQRWTGLPVGAGFGPTKTLAKLANHFAKRAKGATGVHVLDNPEAITSALQKAELTNIWGISGRTKKRLANLGIETPLQFRDADPHYIRRELGVVGQRMVYELRGESCIPLESEVPSKQNICCSRSFGQVASSFSMMREAVATYSSQAAVKLRRQDLVASKVAVFIETDRHAPPSVEQYGPWTAMSFPPTNDSRELAGYAGRCLEIVFRPQHHYKRAGVMLMQLCKREAAQPVLFETRDLDASNRLMVLMDQINRDHGRGTIRLASASSMALNAGRTWHLKSDHRSPRWTTRWDEVPTAISKRNSTAT